jgi:hypothetical protein
VQLARGGCTLRAVGLTIDHQRAGAADSFAAVMIKDNGFLTVGDQTLVQNVEHFEKRRLVSD